MNKNRYKWKLKPYNLFDFKTYQVEYNPYGFDIYAKIYQTSTPWKRLKCFLQELKELLLHQISV
jgi:hypothetical protein